MKIFVDVGSNIGQTLSAIMEERHGFQAPLFCSYGFDRIFSFEPVSDLSARLADEFRDARITFISAGLWNETCEKQLFSPGTEGASIFADKRNVDTASSATCSFIRASDWFRENLSDADEVYVKLNCEGAEADIIEDLLATGEYRKIKSLGATFDVKKIPSQRHREDEIKGRLVAGGHLNHVDLDSFGRASIRDRTRAWLDSAGAADKSLLTQLRRKLYNGRLFAARVLRYTRRRLNHTAGGRQSGGH